MKRKLDTGHYTSSSAGKDDSSSLRGLIWPIKALNLGGMVHVMMSHLAHSSLHFRAQTAFDEHDFGRESHLLS